MSTTTLNDLLADGLIAALRFHTGGIPSFGASSRHTRAFVAELSQVLTAATPRKPLIITTDKELTAIFRILPNDAPELKVRSGATMRFGIRFADIDGMRGHVTIDTQLELPDGGCWSEGRTPVSVARWELPVYDTTTVSGIVAGLVERWQVAGKLVDVEHPAVKSRPSDIELQRAPTNGEPSRIARFTEGEREALKYVGVE